MGMSKLSTSRSICTRRKCRRCLLQRSRCLSGHCMYSDSFTLPTDKQYCTVYANRSTCLCHRRSWWNCTVYHDTTLPVYSYWIMRRVLLVLQFKLESLKFKLLRIPLCTCCKIRWSGMLTWGELQACLQLVIWRVATTAAVHVRYTGIRRTGG